MSNSNQIWDKKLRKSKREYCVEDFNYLLRTKRYDPDDGLEYKVIAIRQKEG
jgi:hypothetical protein